MRPALPFFAILACVSCHGWKPDGGAQAATPGEYCVACCGQAQDACKFDSAHPGYYCPRQYQECTKACVDHDENEMCVIDTNKRYAALAPKPAASAPASPPVATVRTLRPELRGECDKQGTWTLELADASGRGQACAGLASVPREVTFRIERRRAEYALSDLAPVPGWEDAFTVENQPDRCGVTLTRTRRADGATRTVVIALTARDSKVDGTFRYAEQLPKPAVCELSSTVTGSVQPLAPAEPPPQSLPPRPALPQPRDPTLGPRTPR